jgi:transketolase
MALESGRDGFGKALLELGETNSKVVALSADLTESIRAHWFAERYPHRFFQMGVAEQDMIGTSAGLALTGFIPFATTFAVFAAQRAQEQIRMAACYNRSNVKIAVSHGGLTVGEDGATHQGLEDIAVMRVLPEMTVLVPADSEEARLATLAAAEWDGPVYLRLGRTPTPIVTENAEPFQIGKARLLAEGNDVTIVACGIMVNAALQAREMLVKEGVTARVIDMHTIKPLDQEALLKAAVETKCMVTAEEHSVIGGLGGAVTEFLSAEQPIPILRVGTQDTFGESGTPDALLDKYHLTPEAIKVACQKVIQAK